MDISSELKLIGRCLLIGLIVSLVGISVGGTFTTAVLELKLKVEMIQGTTDSIACHVTLVNKDIKPITLVSKEVRPPQGYKYSDALKSYVQLRTVPVTNIHTAQTSYQSGIARSSISQKLEPNGKLEVSWKCTCGRLKPPDKDGIPKSPCLFEPGLYKVIANYKAVTIEGQVIDLESNAAVLPFGQSTQQPKLTVVGIANVEKSQQIATLAAGMKDGLEIGQVFFGRTRITSGWRLTVIETADHLSTAKMAPVYSFSSTDSGLQSSIGALGNRHEAVRWDTYFRSDGCSPLWLGEHDN